jgi:hypothetical protein
MKHALLLVLVVACNHGAPAPENAPPAARLASSVAAAPALPAPDTAKAPPPGCYTPPAQVGSDVVLGGWSGAFVGSNAPVDCSPGQNAAAIYCEHVHDRCCVPGGWTCNNARYEDWYAQQCRH